MAGSKLPFRRERPNWQRGGRDWSVSRSAGFTQIALVVHVDRHSIGASRWSSPATSPQASDNQDHAGSEGRIGQRSLDAGKVADDGGGMRLPSKRASLRDMMGLVRLFSRLGNNPNPLSELRATMSDQDIVETYRNCKIRCQSMSMSTGAGVAAAKRYNTVATRLGGNKSSLRATTIEELKRKIDSYMDQ